MKYSQTSASVVVGGLQPWSAGDLVPWMIVVVENGRSGRGECYGLNGETGQQGPSFHYYRKGSCFGGFRTAHELAEQDCRDRLDGTA